jgi:diguanylate cyclase (GGDEF)-like protein
MRRERLRSSSSSIRMSRAFSGVGSSSTGAPFSSGAARRTISSCRTRANRLGARISSGVARRGGASTTARWTTEPALLASGTRIGIGSTIFKFLSGSRLEAQYHQEIYGLTVCDGLTQVYRERYLVELLDKEIVRAQRRGSALALLLIEVDGLGPNGPPNAGDHVLREVAALLRRSVRAREEILARFGAERFVMVLPERTLETARGVAECLCQKVANSPLAVGPRRLRATVCIGGAQLRDDDRASAGVLERANHALRVAKSRGRNQLECKGLGESPSSGPGT